MNLRNNCIQFIINYLGRNFTINFEISCFGDMTDASGLRSGQSFKQLPIWRKIQAITNKAVQGTKYVAKEYVGPATQKTVQRTVQVTQKAVQKTVEVTQQHKKQLLIGIGIGIGIGIALPLIIKYTIVSFGFGENGIVSESWAAIYQSQYLKGFIAQGSWFALLQSLGAKGLAISTVLKTGLFGGAVAPITKNWKKDNKDPASQGINAKFPNFSFRSLQERRQKAKLITDLALMQNNPHLKKLFLKKN